MTMPEAGPADLDAVTTRAKAPEGDAHVSGIVDAVNAFVRTTPKAVIATAGDAVAEWPADIVEGATMLALRVYRRKNTPGGVDPLSADGFVYVRRNDPDIAMLLGFGDWAKPAVG